MPDPLARYDAIFQAAGKEWNVDPMLLRAIAAQESRGNPNAVSTAGAGGLMQIMPDTARGLGVTNVNDPVQSIYGAAKYMDEALDAEKSPDAALYYYHGGPRWREKFGQESQGYVVGDKRSPGVAGYFKMFSDAAAKPYVVGDSLAQGVAQAGKLEANATQGLGPQKVLSAILGPSMGSVLGRDVILSSGLSNDPSKADTVAEQIAELKARGARNVTLLGVGDHPTLTGANDKLAAIAKDGGATFQPIDPTTLAADRIHPKDYRPLLSSAQPVAEQPPAPDQPTQTAGQ